MRNRVARLPFLCLIAGSLGGCSAYDQRFIYDPPIAMVAAEADAAIGADEVRTLASIIGIRNRDRAANLPACVEVRLRIENDSPRTVEFDASGLSLLAANLEAFPEPLIHPAGELLVAPGGRATISAFFPLEGPRTPPPPRAPAPAPAPGYDLTGLSLQWQLTIDGSAVHEEAGFIRRPTGYGYPCGPYGYTSFGVYGGGGGGSHHSGGRGVAGAGVGIRFGW